MEIDKWHSKGEKQFPRLSLFEEIVSNFQEMPLQKQKLVWIIAMDTLMAMDLVWAIWIVFR